MKKQKTDPEIYLILVLVLILLIVRIFAAANEEQKEMCMSIIHEIKYEDKAFEKSCKSHEITRSSESFQKMSSSYEKAIKVGFSTSVGFEGFEVSKSMDIENSWKEANSQEIGQKDYFSEKKDECIKYDVKSRQLMKTTTTVFEIKKTLKGVSTQSSFARKSKTVYVEAIPYTCGPPRRDRLLKLAKQDIESLKGELKSSDDVIIKGTTESYKLIEKKCGEDRKYSIDYS